MSLAWGYKYHEKVHFPTRVLLSFGCFLKWLNRLQDEKVVLCVIVLSFLFGCATIDVTLYPCLWVMVTYFVWMSDSDSVPPALVFHWSLKPLLDATFLLILLFLIHEKRRQLRLKTMRGQIWSHLRMLVWKLLLLYLVKLSRGEWWTPHIRFVLSTIIDTCVSSGFKCLYWFYTLFSVTIF